MFQKPAFGSNTSGFGSFSSGTTTASPFGGFKPTAGTSAFGAPPAFGASATSQPTTGGLFGASNTTGGLFGTSTAAAPAPAFGSTNTGFGFGANTSTGGGLFSNNTNTGLFNQNTSAFGAKPGGFGFGGTSTAGTTGTGLFGASTSTAGTGLFNQQPNALGSTLFSNNPGSAFGQQASGTAHAKYNPVVGTDVVVKSGTSQNINIKHHCITCMKEYENKSLEELRLEDYTAGRKGSTSGVFNSFQQPVENKPLFGGSTFGQPATTSAPSVFGGGALGTTGGFGQTNAFSFGSNAQNTTNTTSFFGASKPSFGATPATGTGLFSAATTQAPTFGTNTPSFGFGATNQNQSTGIFGQKPAATTGFGSFGSGIFGAKTQTTTPAFGSTTPAFGNMSSGFGTNTATSSGLFSGNMNFGKPATSQPAFGFNTQSAPLGGGLGTGLGASAFPAKPAVNGFGSDSIFRPNLAPTNNFMTGLDGGLGGGSSMFGNTGSLGTSGLGMGALGGAAGGGLNSSLTGASGAVNIHEQMLNLVARPYGDSPLFKDLLPDSSTTAEDALKPTNPAAMKAVLDMSNSGGYRVTSPAAGIRLRVQPRGRGAMLSQAQKSLFDGLEESDASLEDKLTLKPSRKRLVLRQHHSGDGQNDSVDHTLHTNRSLEETHHDTNSGASRDAIDAPKDKEQHVRQLDYNKNLDVSGDRPGSWLSSRKTSWEEKEKPIEEQTPRLYPDLDKELPAQISERRASWLTTKPLRKPLVANPDITENSVRELGVRTERSPQLVHDKENDDRLSGENGDQLNFCCHRFGQQPGCSKCEKIAHQIGGLYVSEEENVAAREAPAHPTGVKLTRPGYYTIPSLDEMTAYLKSDGTCVVPHLTVGRRNYGNVFYDCEIDVAGLDLDSLVHFLNKEVIVYPEDADKPPVGQGLNRRAIVTLDRIWPRDKTDKCPITDPERLMKMDYEGKLRRVCDKHDTKFIEYRPQTGSWVFRVEHFSKYGLTDSDEEDDITPEVIKRQLVNQALQKASAPLPIMSMQVTSPGLGGLGGAGVPTQAAPTLPEDSLFAMQQTSLNLLNGAARAFEMDTTEDNAEAPSLYQDTSRAFGVKSPTSELARLENRQSHNVQLMKASLYADADMEDDMSISTGTGDQQVPHASLSTMLTAVQPVDREEIVPSLPVPPVLQTEELQMKPLMLRPQTIVLRYHRKVPPLGKTIAGGVNAQYIADMSVCRARHSRAGFGPGGTIAYATTVDSIAHLPKSADLSDLDRYVSGRSPEDWSEPLVARLAIMDTDTSAVQEALSKHLEVLLEMSSSSPSSSLSSADSISPRLSLSPSPRDRRTALARHLQIAAEAAKGKRTQYGVSSAYSYEVWRLCEALWGGDLDLELELDNESEGERNEEMSSVRRYRALLEWLVAAVGDVTDMELARHNRPEQEDESDLHSARVWTLLLGGRVLEACKLCRHNDDLHMAMLIAQASGDAYYRSLIDRQLSLWAECGAECLMSSYRVATLRVLAGRISPRDKLLEADWLRALHATARYLCPQIPSLEKIITTYESLFVTNEQDVEDVDLTVVEDSMGMQYPLPPYLDQYDVSVNQDNKHRRILDLRYELIRARAFNSRPKLQPASHTPDPMDYSLCFLLGTWFGNPSIESITGIADRLEAAGAWELAVQALAYHPDDGARGHLIRGVLSRHAPAKADTPELKSKLALIKKLKVPEKWLLLAQAHRAKYEHLPHIEAAHLVAAQQWNAAHTLLLDKLLPDAVLADNLGSISPLVERLSEAAARHEVSGWERGGLALYHYIHVCDEIRGLVSNAEAAGDKDRDSAGDRDRDRAAAHARLEALRPRVAAACRALAGLLPRSPRSAAARSEMGARLVQVCVTSQEPPGRLATLLAALALPPDCTAPAALKITTELAEQASELCIESASSSPISSHHRATIQS